MSDESLQATVSILFGICKAPPSCLVSLKDSFKNAKNLEFSETKPLAEVEQSVKSKPRSIAFLIINDKGDIAPVANFLMSVQKQIKDKSTIVLIFLQFKSDKVEELLMRTGCAEVLNFNVSPKAFAHKFKRFVLIQEQARNVNDSDISEVLGGKQKQNSDSDKLSSLKGGPNNEVNVQLKASEVSQTPPLTGPWDFWLFRKKSHAKRIRRTWLVELIGPSPSVGQWRRAEKQETGLPPEHFIWEWFSRAGSGPFYPEKGMWYYRGKKPIYNWLIHRWGFYSEKPFLQYREYGVTKENRFNLVDDHRLLIAQNSDYAIQLFAEMKKTYDRDYYLKFEKDDMNSPDYVFEKPDSIPWTDRTSSKDIDDDDWGVGDLSKGAGPDWNNILPLSNEPPKKKLPFKAAVDMDFSTGADAMEACGLLANVSGTAVSILNFFEEEQKVVVGAPLGVFELNSETMVEVRADNLEIPLVFNVYGKVTEVQSDPDLTDLMVEIALSAGSIKSFKSAMDAIQKRQEQVLAFFKAAKGL